MVSKAPLQDSVGSTRTPEEITQLATRHVWHHATQVAEYADIGPVMLVEGSGARAGILDPLGATLTPGPSAYGEVLRNLAKALRGCLAG